MSTAIAGTPTAARAQAARRGLAIYFAVLIPATAAVEALMLRAGGSIDKHPLLVPLLMWVPALASFVARGVLREGIGDVSFRLGGSSTGRAMLVALAMPLAVGTAAYGAAWASGLVAYSPPRMGFLLYLLLALVVNTLAGILFAGGEEIGWRGYMLTRLVDAGVPHPLLVSGLIWAAWHLPLILSGQYAAGPYPALSAALFAVAVIAMACVIGILRLRTGSVWPSIVLHACWNAVIQGPFDRSAAGPNAKLWVGESGLLVAAATVAFAVAVAVFDRRHRIRLSLQSLPSAAPPTTA
jgi:uncharacterized protein